MQAETRFQLGDYKGTAAAYEKAMAVAPSIDLLQNLAAAYVNDGKPQAAIDAVKAAGQHLPSNQDELVALGYGDSELSLLLGRVYAQWPGHDGQALDIYDKLIQKNPDDFRQVVLVSHPAFMLKSIHSHASLVAGGIWHVVFSSEEKAGRVMQSACFCKHAI